VRIVIGKLLICTDRFTPGALSSSSSFRTTAVCSSSTSELESAALTQPDKEWFVALSRTEETFVGIGVLLIITPLFRQLQSGASQLKNGSLWILERDGPVGGFPTYNFAVTGPGIIRGRGPALPSMIVVLLTPEAAVWQDVVLYWNPSLN
jgi:hypothetical protein